MPGKHGPEFYERLKQQLGRSGFGGEQDHLPSNIRRWGIVERLRRNEAQQAQSPTAQQGRRPAESRFSGGIHVPDEQAGVVDTRFNFVSQGKMTILQRVASVITLESGRVFGLDIAPGEIEAWRYLRHPKKPQGRKEGQVKQFLFPLHTRIQRQLAKDNKFVDDPRSSNKEYMALIFDFYAGFFGASVAGGIIGAKLALAGVVALHLVFPPVSLASLLLVGVPIAAGAVASKLSANFLIHCAIDGMVAVKNAFKSH